MNTSEMSIQPVFSIGMLEFTNTAITSMAIVAGLGGIFWFISKQLVMKPGRVQVVVEAIVGLIENAVAEAAPQHVKMLTPFIGSLWVYLVIANLIGLVPGLDSPTRDLSATAPLAIIVFLSTHWFGIRSQGIKIYLQHYLKPSPLLLPFHIIGEITRTIALAVRLFGNMMSLEMAALLVLLVAGFLAPVPVLLLHIVEALVQAYIFGMLALVYVAGGIQAQQVQQNNQDEEGVTHD